MNETEKYLFDVHGYLIIKNVLSPKEIAQANAAIDHHANQVQIRPNDLARTSTTLQGTQGRGDLGGLLTWDKPHCNVFRNMMIHPKLTPHLKTLLGPGFRLVALSAILMDEGAEGFWFHEGGEPLDRSRTYRYHNGNMYCGMTNIAIQLTDVGPNDGGFACLPGSHKANYPCPDDIRLYQTHQDRITHISAQAGDAILFVECLMHGSLPWRAKHQRRSIIMRYNNAVTTERLMGNYTPPPFYDDLTDAQKTVIGPPQYQHEDKGSMLYKANQNQ